MANHHGGDRRKPKTMHIPASRLWPSTLYMGNTVLRFLTGKKGRKVRVEYHGNGRVRHKPLHGK